MITYWDTSAVVPLLVAEAGSAVSRELWDHSTFVVSTRLLFVEASAAMQQAHRLGRIDTAQLGICLSSLEDYWADFDVVELNDSLMHQSAVAAGRFGLRGYDAMHCAAGLLVATVPSAVLVSGDAKLLSAWHSAGASTAAISPPSPDQFGSRQHTPKDSQH